LVEFHRRGSGGPWNPLVQAKPEDAPLPAAEGMTMASTLLLGVSLLAMVAGAALIRRRNVRRAP